MLHEALKPLSWLTGRWITEAGEGKYPTINSFLYHDEMEFICIGQPMFNYTAKSSHPTKKTPMHQERGFLRIKPGTTGISLVLSHNFGLTSIENGHYNEQDKVLTLKTVSIERISFAKDPKVKAFERTLKLLSPDTLEVVVAMETENTPMTEHLRAVYKKLE